MKSIPKTPTLKKVLLGGMSVFAFTAMVVASAQADERTAIDSGNVSFDESMHWDNSETVDNGVDSIKFGNSSIALNMGASNSFTVTGVNVANQAGSSIEVRYGESLTIAGDITSTELVPKNRTGC